jgi:protein-disulfide isomerase
LRPHLILLAVAFGLAGAPSATAQAPAPPLTREQVEAIVRDYLLRNPEIIVEAIDGLEEKRRQATESSQRDALAAKRVELVNDPDAPVAGNPDGDVTIVEFFDYRCPYCKQVVPTIAQLLRADGKVRVVYKELPILGPDSVVAARAALAARAQGKYHQLHEALMRARGTLDEATVLKIAADAGIEVARLKADMGKPEIEAIIDRNRRLARALSLTGTPAFIIGNKIVPGAVDIDTLKKLVAEARRS